MSTALYGPLRACQRYIPVKRDSIWHDDTSIYRGPDTSPGNDYQPGGDCGASIITAPGTPQFPPQREVLAWFDESKPYYASAPAPAPEPTPEPASKYPDPATLGAVLYGTVTRGGIYTRTEPAIARGNATIKGYVGTGDEVKFRQKAWHNPVDGYDWLYLEDRGLWVSTLAQIKPDVIVGEVISVLIHDLPFVTQLNTNPDSNLRGNDCLLADGVAWALMRLTRKGYGTMPLLKVDNIVPFTALAKSDRPITMDEAGQVLNLLGLPFVESSMLTLDAIRAEVDHFRPPILLGNYAWIDKTSKVFGHFFIVVGYGDGWFWINDPYSTGPQRRFSGK